MWQKSTSGEKGIHCTTDGKESVGCSYFVNNCQLNIDRPVFLPSSQPSLFEVCHDLIVSFLPWLEEIEECENRVKKILHVLRERLIEG